MKPRPWIRRGLGGLLERGNRENSDCLVGSTLKKSCPAQADEVLHARHLVEFVTWQAAHVCTSVDQVRPLLQSFSWASVAATAAAARKDLPYTS